MNAEIPAPDLPANYTAEAPTPEDIDDIAHLVGRIRAWLKDPTSTGVDEINVDEIEAAAIGAGAWTRRQLVIRDADGDIVAWPVVHDRAAGRALIELDIHPEAQNQEQLAAALLDWMSEAAQHLAIMRGLSNTQLDATVYDNDHRQRIWLKKHGYDMVRTMSNMTRPVTAAETTPPPHKNSDQLRIRTVDTHETNDGSTTPVAEDLQAVHAVIEESFADHFNSRRESTPEFLQRQRESPGHRWDHWWLAETENEDGTWAPAGAVVSSILPEDNDGIEGSYVEYIGVARNARGLGVAKALLNAVCADAARRGRNRVNLEVDNDSPTNANVIYAKLGWNVYSTTESWHKEVDADPRIDPNPTATDTIEALHEWLDYFRGTLAMKIDGLTPEQLCRPPLDDNPFTLLGLVRHLTDVENYWFTRIALGQPSTPLYNDPGNADADFTDGTAETSDIDIAAWHAQCTASRQIVASITDPDQPLPGKRNGEETNLRWILTHLATEYARHCGHADLLRQATDGVTGD